MLQCGLPVGIRVDLNNCPLPDTGRRAITSERISLRISRTGLNSTRCPLDSITVVPCSDDCEYGIGAPSDSPAPTAPTPKARKIANAEKKPEIRRSSIKKEPFYSITDRRGIAVQVTVVSARYINRGQVRYQSCTLVEPLAMGQQAFPGPYKQAGGLDSRQRGFYLLLGHHQCGRVPQSGIGLPDIPHPVAAHVPGHQQGRRLGTQGAQAVFTNPSGRFNVRINRRGCRTIALFLQRPAQLWNGFFRRTAEGAQAVNHYQPAYPLRKHGRVQSTYDAAQRMADQVYRLFFTKWKMTVNQLGKVCHVVHQPVAVTGRPVAGLAVACHVDGMDRRMGCNFRRQPGKTHGVVQPAVNHQHRLPGGYFTWRVPAQAGKGDVLEWPVRLPAVGRNFVPTVG